MDKREYVPRALREVWEWKDSVARDVEGLPTPEALYKIMNLANETAERYSFGAVFLCLSSCLHLALADSFVEQNGGG